MTIASPRPLAAAGGCQLSSPYAGVANSVLSPCALVLSTIVFPRAGVAVAEIEPQRADLTKNAADFPEQLRDPSNVLVLNPELKETYN
jgi:hypothetical protein